MSLFKPKDSTRHKVNRGFRVPGEAVIALIAGVVMVASVVSAGAFGLSSLVAAGKAWKEYRTVYQPTDSLLRTAKVPVQQTEYTLIAGRLTSPGVTVTVSPSGITLAAARIDSMQDHEVWRASIDRVMTQIPGAEWQVVELCYGTKCSGSAAKVTLSATRVTFSAAPPAPTVGTEGVPPRLPG